MLSRNVQIEVQNGAELQINNLQKTQSFKSPK